MQMHKQKQMNMQKQKQKQMQQKCEYKSKNIIGKTRNSRIKSSTKKIPTN